MTDSEQWKSNGECDKCRKQTYCTKQCSARKRRVQRIVNQTITNSMIKRLEEKYGE